MGDLPESLGGKRKYKENPLTAKAETGSLRIKIVRKGEGVLGGGVLGTGLGSALDGYAFTGAPRSPSKSAPAPPPQPIPSPPKPRANRKHVPIFYQRPNAFSLSASSSTSTDENASQPPSVTSEYETSYSASGTSTSSTTTRFARLDIAPGLPGSLQDPMPPMNPLFTRGTSETSGSLTDLLKTVLPTVPPLQSTGSYTDYSSGLPTSGPEPLTPSSQSSLLNPAAALRQLASSSAAYASHTREPTVLPSMHLHRSLQRFQTLPLHTDLEHHHDYQNGYHTEQDQRQDQRHDTPLASESEPNEQDESPSYRFDAMSALQNAVKIAVQSATPTSEQPTTNRWPSESEDNDLGPPPMGPPSLSIQHSLMGGGIESQPVIPTINTVNFNWNRYRQQHAATRSRSGSIPSSTADEISEGTAQSPSAVHDQ